MLSSLLLPILLCPMATPVDLPTIEVTADDTLIAESCRIVIPEGLVIEDANGDGVIQIGASDIEIEFAEGSVLRGCPPGTRPDEYRGYGIRLNSHQGVSICNARISGYWCGLWASAADGLTLDGIDASDNRRAFLKSTAVAEDGSDWLFPHHNDNNEWLDNYGAAIYVEDSGDVTVRGCKVWHGQNALCIDRVNDSKIYDNDFSFNSGWGIAMWRSSGNLISRNACDFCVRGYSHGVYNRGQDSAGILMFEQCCDNYVAENSATHGGDGFFGFAGREALGEAGKHPPKWYERRGNTGDILTDNDFSYAVAHGIEMTFSFANYFVNNRLVGNAICGVWGGYSQDTLIADNTVENNGEMAYGLERGGVNIEHGTRNRILRNTFRDNKCGVHLWWDPDEGLADKPWAKANGVESSNNLITGNEFDGDQLAFHFRGKSDVIVGLNELKGVEKEMEAGAEVDVRRDDDPMIQYMVPERPVHGDQRPVGARKQLRGRENIIMTEWGPWDHESPLVRLIEDTGDSLTYELRKLPGKPDATIKRGLVQVILFVPEKPGLPARYTIKATRPGVHPFVARVWAGDFERTLTGTLVSTTWNATFFNWTKDSDPREDLKAWRALARGTDAVSAQLAQLKLKYAWRGPSDQNLSDELQAAKLGADRFGMIAKTKLPLRAGKWQFTTTSDDGVRVTIDGQPVIENWTHHGPTQDTGTFKLAADKTVEIVVEHFEIDGHATLELAIQRAQ